MADNAPTMDRLDTIALDYAKAIWRRKWLAVAVCWVICLAGWTGVVMMPNIYQSNARVNVNTDALLTPLLRGIAIDTDPRQELDYLHRTLLSRPNIEQLIHLTELDGAANTPAAREKLIANLAKDISLTQQTPNLFVISYKNQRARVAKNVVDGVLTIFSENTIGNNRAEMDNAERFLTQQIASYEKQLRDAEARRAAFREKYPDIHANGTDTDARVQAAATEVQRLNRELSDARAKRDTVKRELDNVPRYLDSDQVTQIVVNNGEASSPRSRYEAAQRRLEALLLVDTEQHPDVIAARREVAALKTAAETEAKPDPTDNKPGRGKVSNSVYDQLQLRLVDIDGTIASLQHQLTDAQAEHERLDAALRAAPGIELQAKNLDRDYDVIKKNYEELLSRRESKHISEAADTQADKIEFRIVDPPQIPIEPVSPNRPVLILGVLIAGIGGGVGVAFLMAQLDRSFNSLRTLRTLGLPIIGAVSMIQGVDARRRGTIQLASFAGSAAALFLIMGLLLARTVGIRFGLV